MRKYRMKPRGFYSNHILGLALRYRLARLQQTLDVAKSSGVKGHISNTAISNVERF